MVQIELMLLSFSILMVFVLSEMKIGLEKNAPADERITFGLNRSKLGLVMIIESTPTASAVRISAPTFPGFSGDSITKINDLLFSFRFFMSVLG